MTLHIEKQDGLGVWCDDNPENGRYRGRRLSWTEYKAAQAEPAEQREPEKPVESYPKQVERKRRF
jgi:hypothetical protein